MGYKPTHHRRVERPLGSQVDDRRWNVGQAIGITLFVIGSSFWIWFGGSVLLGIGTALVYPTLLAAVSDVAHPNWRASAVGVYRLWRDAGYAVGAFATGLLADAFGGSTAISMIGVLIFLSGVLIAALMSETI